MKKKSINKIIGAIMLGVLLCACAKEESGDLEPIPEEFLGEWECGDSPLENPDYYTGFLKLRVLEDGYFSMYDVEAGNPGICGDIEILSDKELQLNGNTEEEFSPPPTWEEMQENQILTYQFVSEDELYLTFEKDDGNSTLIFNRIK